MIPLTKEKRELHEMSKTCYIFKRKFMQKCTKDRNYIKVRDHCHYTCKYKGAAHSICNLKLNVPNDLYILANLFICQEST